MARVELENNFVAVNENTNMVTVDGSLLVNSGSDFNGLLIPCSILATITEITIAGGGTDYEVGDVVTIVQDDNTTATAVVTSVDETGAITGISIIDGGSGYTDDTDLTVTGGSGTGATVNITDVTSITQNAVGAVTSTSQGIRMNITIDDEDVTDGLVGGIQVSHNLNYISSFTLNLGNPKYSPLVDTHIAVDSVVVITAYINGNEIKMFTGLVDETKSRHTEGGYILTITGRDYGKKLLNTTKTLISVQDRASNSYRGNIVKYMASQAGITDVVIPTGDRVTIDHSFQDQTIWDMIQKECAIEGWYVRFDENGTMRLQTRDTDATASWEYGEDKFTELGLQTSDEGIINKVTILGAIFEETEITVETTEGTPIQITVNPTTYDTGSSDFSKSFSKGEPVSWSESDGDFSIKASYKGAATTELIIGDLPTAQTYRFDITKQNSDLQITNTSWSVGGSGTLMYHNDTQADVQRDIDWEFGLAGATEKAFSVTATISYKEQTGGGTEKIEGTAPSETFTETITYEQVKATVQDNTSIATYGERKPNNEGTLNYPLAETEAQCQRIGENIIKDNHRFIKQPDFNVIFNPMLIVGQKVELTDKKIGYDEDDYFVEEVIHYIDIDKEGKVTARTRIGCVYYA